MPKTPYSYPKNQRLLVAKDFKTVFDHISFKIHQPCFTLFIHTKSNGSTSRLGLAITKKKLKKANQRNRLKRLTREYFRLHQHQLIQPVDMVLTVKTLPKETTNQQIFEQLQQAFFKINDKLQQKNVNADVSIT